MSKKLYETLGVNDKATADELKKAHRRAAKANHPDKGGDEDKMKEINKAYDVLSNPLKKKIYDETGIEEVNEKIEIRARIEEIMEHLMKDDPANVESWLMQCRRKLNELVVDAKRNNNKIIEDKKRFLSRIKKRPEEDFVGAYIENQIAAIELNNTIMQKDFEYKDKAFEFLLTYVFEVKPQTVAMNWGNMQNAGSMEMRYTNGY